MKKVLLTLILALCAMSMFAAKATPAQIQEWQKKLDNAKNNWEKVYNQSKIDILSDEAPVSYQAIYEKVLAVSQKYQFNDKISLRDMSFQIVLHHCPELVVETYKEVIKTKSILMYNYTYCYFKELGLSKEDMFDNYYFVLMQFHNNPNRVIVLKNCVKNFLDAAAEVDEVKVKKALKVLNRKYSPKLLEDKATWEPVVAMIRTALETY